MKYFTIFFIPDKSLFKVKLPVLFYSFINFEKNICSFLLENTKDISGLIYL